MSARRQSTSVIARAAATACAAVGTASVLVTVTATARGGAVERAQQGAPAGPAPMTIPASGRSWTSPDGSYGFNVDVWAPSSFYTLTDTPTTLESGDIPFEIRGSQTMTFKPGTTFRSAQAVKDIDLVYDILVDTLARSEDMRTKLKDACEKQGVSSMAIRLVRGDPKVDGGVYRKASNFFVMDLADLEAAAGRLSAPDVPAAQAASGLDLLSSMRVQIITTAAHETQHARGEGNEDPTPESGNKGLPVLDENHVLGDLGVGLERTAYGAIVDGLPVVPWEYTTVAGGKTTTIVLLEGASQPSTATGPALDGAQRLGPADLQSLEGLPGRCCSGEASFPSAGTDDTDFDGIVNVLDNCPVVVNPQQGAGDCRGAPPTQPASQTRNGKPSHRVADSQILIDVPLPMAGEWAAEFADLDDLNFLETPPMFQVRAQRTRLGGPIVTDRRWFFAAGHRVAVGYDALSGKPTSLLIADSDWDEDWIEVTDVRVASARVPSGGTSSGRAIRPWESGSTRDWTIALWARMLGPPVAQILPDFVGGLVTLLVTRRASPAARVPGAFDKAAVAEDEQGQVTIVPRSAEADIGVPGGNATPPDKGFAFAARSLLDLIRPKPMPGSRAAALPAGVRVVTSPSGRLEYWIDPQPQAAGTGTQASPERPRPSLKIFLQSLGRSTGENAMQALVINDGNVPVRLMEHETFVTEPLEGISQQTLSRELAKYAGRPRLTMKLAGYCLNFRKAPPTAGRILRVASREAQAQAGGVRRILRAAERLQHRGAFHPDGDPVLYGHSIRQWALWTREQGFTERTFGEALVEHTKKNLVTAGKRWNKDAETAVRSLVPGRWRDIRQVLAESDRFMPPKPAQ